MNYSFKHLILAGIAMLAGTLAYAQVTTSSLSGRITDEKGQPALGAAVVATHEPSGTVYGAVVNENGQYNIVGMRAGGPYKVEVSSVGYNSVVYKDVTIQLAEAYKLDAVLKESTEFLEEVVVIGTAKSKFSSEKTGAATNISNEQITSVPTVNRSISDVTRLSPYGGNGMTFAGADGRTANFTVDGANFNNNFGLSDNLPGGGNPISIDALEEMQVVISPYDVRQTNFIGGGVNAITKSGTNTFKGSAYIYHKNEYMRGDTVDGETLSGARDKDRNTIYGFTLGGPIIKNKLFFFVNYEYEKTPTVANRWRGSEDGIMDEDKNISRTTLEDLEKVSKFVKEKYGYDTGSWTSFPADESNRKILARLDWNINSNNRLALRYNYTKNSGWTAPNASSMDAGTRSAYARMSKYSMSYANSMYSMDNLVHTVSVDLNSRISDKISNQFLATFSKLDDVRGSNSSDFPFIDIRNDDGSTVLPYISLGYELFTWHNGVHNNVVTAKDDLTMYFGNHKILAGASYEYQMADNMYMRNGTGYYRYKSLDDFFNGAAPEVVCLTYGYNGEESPAARVRYHKPGIYAQDDWTVSDRFKLSYGLRLDGIFYSNKDLMTNQAIYDLDYAGRHIDTGKWPTAKVTVSPRIGFNWDVIGNKSLTMRGGTGLFSGRLPLVFFTNMPSNGGMVQYQAQIGPKGDSVDMNEFAGGVLNRKELLAKLESLGYPMTITPDKGSIPSSIAAVDPKFKMPQVWKTSLAFDYNFPTSFPFSISAEGIFNKTVNAVCMSDWSVIPTDGFTRLNGADNRPIYQEFKYTYEKQKFNKDGSPVVDEAGNPVFETKNMPSAYMLENTRKGYGWSASVQLNMRPVDGLSIMAAYTHTASKELTSMPGSNASSVLNYMATVNGPNDPGLHNSQNVTPDRFIAAVTHHDKCGNHFSLIYETWRGGYNYSYMTVNDMNGDGYNYDSIYIPTDKEVANGDFRFVSDNDRDRFMGFVHNDKYLSKHQGEYAEAYSVYSPWVHRVDFSYKHDFRVKIGKTTNTLQLSFDIKNLMNLFNSKWGVSKYMNSSLGDGRILKYEGVDAEGYATFSTPSAVSANTETWKYNHAIGQCWYASIGLKYMFN
ncbi:MAG: carboxypeptidase regulatory-like domain-containing protein [Candidatus Cryptobacteroides sp.]